LKSNILSKIESLPSLSKIVIEINNVCSDSKSSLHQVADIVKKDPISSATILKRINSPLYGIMNHVTTVDKAVTMLGKASTRAFILENAIKNSFKIDLSAYNITENDFSVISQQRTSLMIKWYSKVSFPKLNILATSSIIGNVGQILISKEIINSKKREVFLETIEDYGVTEAEKSIVGLTSEEVTANILQHWDFDEILIKSLKYANEDTIEQAEENIKPYAFANHIVHKTIDAVGFIDESKFEEIEKSLEDNNLDSKNFFEVLNIIRKFSNYE
jgi:HD-like signal output (HDOD) protein